jgi:hypothetical protein
MVHRLDSLWASLLARWWGKEVGERWRGQAYGVHSTVLSERHLVEKKGVQNQKKAVPSDEPRECCLVERSADWKAAKLAVRWEH